MRIHLVKYTVPFVLHLPYPRVSGRVGKVLSELRCSCCVDGCTSSLTTLHTIQVRYSTARQHRRVTHSTKESTGSLIVVVAASVPSESPLKIVTKIRLCLDTSSLTSKQYNTQNNFLYYIIGKVSSQIVTPIYLDRVSLF